MVPTLVVYGCTLPAVFAIITGATANVGSLIFLCVSLGAATMQGIADYEMHTFRKNKNGTFIRNGLWKYSRHPNYLGEILMWWGVGLSVVCAFPGAWYFLAGAAANTVLFLAVSIPMADKRQSRKVGFEEYKKQTRMLLPIKK
jgi:steroid 5-alpha reductase family enzyme